MGGGSAIQHLQSDVRGSSSSSSSAVKPLPGYSGEIGRRGSTEHAKALPSPSISTSPPHGSSGSRPTSAEAAGAIPGYPSHPNRRPSTDMREDEPVGEKQMRPRAHMQHSDSFAKGDEEAENDEMEVEIDEIENDMDP
jgi:hypothetical protein